MLHQTLHLDASTHLRRPRRRRRPPCRRSRWAPRTRPPYRPICTRRRLRHRNRRPNSNSNVSLAASLLPLDTHDHVILLAELQARGFPCAEVVARVDGAAAVHLCADGPVLLEVGVVADDGGGVCAFFLPDLVRGTV
jgi:hypothetical protein